MNNEDFTKHMMEEFEEIRKKKEVIEYLASTVNGKLYTYPDGAVNLIIPNAIEKGRELALMTPANNKILQNLAKISEMLKNHISDNTGKETVKK